MTESLKQLARFANSIIDKRDVELTGLRQELDAAQSASDAERLAELRRWRDETTGNTDTFIFLLDQLDTAQSALAEQQQIATMRRNDWLAVTVQRDSAQSADLHEEVVGTPPQPGDAERLARLRQQRDDAPLRYSQGLALAPMVTFQWIDVDFLFQQLDAALAAQPPAPQPGDAERLARGEAERIAVHYHGGVDGKGWLLANDIESALKEVRDTAQSALAEQQQIAAMRRNDWIAVTVQRDSAQSALAESQAEVARRKEQMTGMLTLIKYAERMSDDIAKIITAARSQGERDGIEKAVQIALKYRDEADAGRHEDVGPEHSLGQGFAANSIAKRIRALAAPEPQGAENE